MSGWLPPMLKISATKTNFNLLAGCVAFQIRKCKQPQIQEKTMQKFYFEEKIAVTTNNGLVEFWYEAKDKPGKIFVDEHGRKAILASDNGRRWESAKQTAPFCEYMTVWLGDFPYSSFCWAIRRDLLTGHIRISEISTDINPSGLNATEKWKNSYRTYVSPAVVK